MSPNDNNPRALRPTTAERIAITCDEVKEMLLAKNRAYGDSATSPIRVFSRADATEQLLVRIDDKLSRIARGHTYADEDTVLDLVGYLILLRVQQKKETE